MEHTNGGNAVFSEEKPKMTLEQAGRIIRWARIERGYTTQGQFAEAVGLSKDLINAMERGRKKAGMDSYDKVAEFLGVQFDISFPIQK